MRPNWPRDKSAETAVQAAASQNEATRDSQVRAEQIALVQSQVPGSLGGASVGAAIMVLLLWGDVPASTLLAWFFSVIAVFAALGVQWVFYRHTTVSAEQAHKWGIGLIAIGLAAGIAWGSAGVMLYVPDALEPQLLLLVILFTGTAGTTVGTAVYRPLVLVAVVPFLIPLIIRLASEGDLLHLTLAATAIAYMGVMTVFAINIHQTVLTSIELRFEKAGLVDTLTKRTEEAEQANLGKSRFLAAASHDLRQPLHALGLFVSALDSRIDEPEIQRIVDKIRSSVDALEDLFNALLEISKLDAGVLTTDIQNFQIDALLTRMRADYSPLAKEKGLNFRIVPCAAVVRSDPVMLDRLMRNLISNAINHTATGGVLVGCRRRGEKLRLEVRDSGIGIDEHQIKNIFGEFYQVGNPERDSNKGLGLGLSIAKRIAQLLGTKIDVISQPSKGATFAVEVDVTSSISDAGEVAPSRATDADLADRIIMIIDDNADVLDGMQMLLEDWGCRVVVASSADEGLEQLTEGELIPDVIFADYRLVDDTTGVQAIDQIRQALDANIPAVLVTGDTAPDRLREAQASGYPLLHKPALPAQIRVVLTQALNPAE